LSLEVRLLGGMELRWNETELPLPATLCSRSLLAYLIVHRQQSHPRERLADLLWPDRARAKALRSLSTALWHIRRVLPPGDYILADAHTVQFNPQSDCWFDVEEFLVSGSRVPGPPGPTPETLEPEVLAEECERLWRAVALYRGDFLEGFYDDWCLEERYRLESIYLGTLERLVAVCEALDLPEEALRCARLLLVRDPLREDMHRAVIRLHVRLGNRAEALHQARRCRAVLQSELSVEPALETVALCDELLGPAWRSGPARLERARGPAVRSSLSGLLDHPPFVGREDVWESLLACWERARSGQGLLVLIHGEAGIGKSRLVEELGRWVRQRGGWTARACCYEYEHALPYGPLADLLRTVLPLVGEDARERLLPWQAAELARLAPELTWQASPVPDSSLPADQRQARLFDALTVLLLDLARRNPLLLTLEELHWANDSTLAWLHYLARHLGQVPLLMLATYRQEDVGPGHPLRGLALRLEREGLATRLELGPLSREDLAVWMTGASDPLVTRVYRQAEGNPFFMLETLRTLFEEGRVRLVGGRWVEDGVAGDLPIPTSVRQVVQARLDRLPSHVRRAAEVAAVIGRGFCLEVLGQAWGQGEEATLEALDELLRRRLIREEDTHSCDDYAFAHHLVREAIYQGLHHRRRRRLHRLVGEAMERLHAGRPEVAGELAYHFERAHEREKALLWLVEAGEQAWRGYACREALGYFRCAVALLDPGRADALAARALAGLAVAHRDVIGEEGMEWEWLERALEIWEALDDRRGIAEACYALAYRHDDFERARQMVRRGVEAVARVDGLERLVSYGYGMLARFYEHEGNFPQARLWVERQLELSQRLGDESGLAYAHHRLGSLIMRAGGPMDEAVAHEREAIRLVEGLGWMDLAAGSHSVVGYCLLAQGRTAEAEAEGWTSLRLSTELNIPWRQCWALHLLAEVATLRGRWEEAARFLARTEGMASRQPTRHQEIVLLRTRGQLAARQGDPDGARALLERALDMSRRFYPRFVVELDLELAALSLERGDEEDARQRLARAQVDGRERALALADRLEGRLAARRGDLADAGRAFDASLHRFQAQGQALEAARTQLAWGQALLPHDEPRARALLQAALETFEMAEAHPEAAAVCRLLARPRRRIRTPKGDAARQVARAGPGGEGV